MPTPAYREADRSAFGAVLLGSANPPFIIAGEGSHEHPWSLRLLSSAGEAPTTPPPLTVISIGDDPDGVYQSSPPSAVDYAVMLRNLRKLGAKSVGLGATLVWPDPDPIARTALDTQLGEFEAVAVTAPLTRGSSAEPMPAAFIRASLPLSSVKGDTGKLPMVNRVSLPGTVLGDLHTLAGFSLIESESGSVPLLARWDDRIVFSFSVVSVLAGKGLPADGVEVRLGEYLKLGPQGPFVPIDDYGRLAVEPRPAPAALKPVPAETLVDATSLPVDGSVLFRDDRRATDASMKAFAAALVPVHLAIATEAGMSPVRLFHRLPQPVEAGLFAALVLLLTAFVSGGAFRARLGFGVIAGLVVAVQFTLTPFGLWFPGIAALVVIAAGYLVSWPTRAWDEEPHVAPATGHEPFSSPALPASVLPGDPSVALPPPPEAAPAVVETPAPRVISPPAESRPAPKPSQPQRKPSGRPAKPAGAPPAKKSAPKAPRKKKRGK